MKKNSLKCIRMKERPPWAVFHLTKGKKGGLDNITKKIIIGLPGEFSNEVFYQYDEGMEIYKGLKNQKLRIFKIRDETIFVNLTSKISYLLKSRIIHVHHTKAWIILSPLLFFKNKAIYSFHGNFGAFVKKNFLYKIIISMIMNYCNYFSRKLIFLTEGQKKNLSRCVLNKKSFDRKSVVIHNFIEKEGIITKKKSFNTFVLFIGRYTKIKGFEDLMNLSKEITGINFILVGEPNLKIKQKNIKNIGAVEYNEIARIYDRASIFILPSYTEAFPLTILEAMARGLVILVSDIPGMREIIKEGRNGYLFPPGDVEKMKELILYLKNNPKEIERISKTNLKDVWKFTKEKQVPKYIKVYEEVLGRDRKKKK